MVVSRQEFAAAEPLEPLDSRPTPHAIAVVPDSSDAPSSTDARVDRLLLELMIAIREKRLMDANLTASLKRCTELLEFGRRAKRVVKEFLDESENLAGDDQPGVEALEKLRALAAEVL